MPTLVMVGINSNSVVVLETGGLYKSPKMEEMLLRLYTTMNLPDMYNALSHMVQTQDEDLLLLQFQCSGLDAV